ncbi:hypothetical protein BDP27DRAFT_1313514 [Rhodocollybia butyracea]|uniref:Uncharacterized protein n=1 Tax=Rhodocollybia butyracea TaxID=206335 RepID=A0A9P5Q955_9AGAR|nr:hypothetical protein BDP27DRAFT_1313514 [Rhodocollybia butyracea]
MERFPSPEDVEDEVGGLYTQIQALQEALTTVGRENEDLRSSVQTLTRISRSQSVHHNRLSRNVDTSLSEITRLQVEVDDKANIIATLRSAAELSDTLSHDLSRENAVFRLQIEELTSLLEISNGDAAAQKLVAEELQRETERLRHQLEELRETSTRVPTGGGDEELQNLINEDLSRENRQLRSKTRELQEFIAQRQAPTYELNSLKESTRELTHENKRLQRRVRELESESASRDEARNRAEELDRENARLRRELEQTRRRPVRQNTTDVPPPAYEEIGRR